MYVLLLYIKKYMYMYKKNTNVICTGLSELCFFPTANYVLLFADDSAEIPNYAQIAQYCARFSSKKFLMFQFIKLMIFSE